MSDETKHEDEKVQDNTVETGEKEKREEMPEWAKSLKNKVDQLAEKLEREPEPTPERDAVVLIPEPVPPKQEEEEKPEPGEPEPTQPTRKEKMKAFWQFLK